MAQKRIDTKRIVISALLVGLSIVIPWMSLPVVQIPEFSVTLFAHMAIILAMYMGPQEAAFAGLGSALGFFLKGTPLVVVMRAASHIIFLVLGAVLFNKLPKKKWNIPVVGIITGVAHALCEAAIVAFWFKTVGVGKTFSVGIGIFFLHHTFDFIMATVLYFAMVRAKVVKNKFKQ